MLPGTVLFVVGSDVVAKTVSDGKIPWVLIFVFVVTVVFIIFLVKHARRKLKTEEGKAEDERNS
jgi:membrane protein implicated in regulation of membrane protease activity